MKKLAGQIIILTVVQSLKSLGQNKKEASRKAVLYAVRKEVPCTVGELDQILDYVYDEEYREVGRLGSFVEGGSVKGATHDYRKASVQQEYDGAWYVYAEVGIVVGDEDRVCDSWYAVDEDCNEYYDTKEAAIAAMKLAVYTLKVKEDS